MGLGTGVPNFKPALFLLCQDIAEWGLCVCMPRLHEAPCSLHDREKNMPEPWQEGRTDHGKEGQGHSVEP